MISEGKIAIEMARRPQGDQLKVRIGSNRRTDVGRILKDRTTQEALSLLPMIFSVCGKAHSCVASQAFQSLDLEDGRAETAGQLVVLAENAREHLLRVVLGWSCDRPELVKQFPVKQVMSLVADMTKAVREERAVRKAVSDLATGLATMLQEHLFSCPPEQWLQMKTVADLETWIEANETISGLYLGEICDRDWQSVGALEPKFLPALPMKDLREKLHRERGRFISQPDWQGVSYETGPLARRHDHPLVANIMEEYGAGLLARNIARLIELAGLPQAMSVLAAERYAEQKCASDQVSGISAVETARGRLVHSVKMSDGRIDDYHILAPTEWNFHPRGAAAKSLQTLVVKNDDDLHQQAQMIIEAIDPCVDFEVRIV